MKTKMYKILRDTQEKKNYWTFAEDENCLEVIPQHLDTGDYTIEGLEDRLTIDRKASTGEFAKNITEQRFFRELQRMEKFDHAFLILCFNMDDILNFPYGSGIPKNKWNKLRVGSAFILKRILEIETSYKVKIIFAGNHGEHVAEKIFHRVIELYR